MRWVERLLAVVGLGCAGVAVMGQAASGPVGNRAATTGAGKVPFTISKETTAITGPLRADGTVDYVAALNEKYGKGVKPEENGFVKWLEVTGTGEDVIPEKVRTEMLRMCGAKE